MLFAGRIEKIYCQRENWYAFLFCDKNTLNRYSVAGTTAYPLYEKAEIKIEGEEYFDKQYGRKIQVSSIIPYNENEIFKKYLVYNLPYINNEIADQLIKQYGTRVIEEIKRDPNILLKFKGIKNKKIRAILVAINELGDSIHDQINLFNLFSGRISEGQISKIISYMKASHTSFEDIKKNPYILIRKIDGFGFKTIDALGRNAGINIFSENRVYAALVHSLKDISYTEGHVYAGYDMLVKRLRELLFPLSSIITGNLRKKILDIPNIYDYDMFLDDIPEKYHQYLEGYFKDLTKLQDIVDKVLSSTSEDIVIDKDRIYWKSLYSAEKNIAAFLTQKIRETDLSVHIKDMDHEIEEYEKDHSLFLADEQKDAIKNAFDYTISVISGGPGRGKSTITDAIIQIWKKNLNDNVVLLAPTGKAAKRMMEITKLPAKTIHNALITGLTKHFSEYRQNDYLIILDECSMVGIQLFDRLIKTLNESCSRYHFVLIGDIDQLASIEPGNLLCDIIQSECVPATKLVKGFRNAGSIALNAAAINNGEGFNKLIFDHETEFIEAENTDILQKTIDAYQKALTKFDRNEILILSPMKKIGQACTENINKVLSDMTASSYSFAYYNPDCPFRYNDRVIQTVNQYDKIYHFQSDDEFELDYGKGVFNGDLGTITHIDSSQLTVKFDDGRISDYQIPREANRDLLLSYAMTVHKAQGSEADCVIVIISKQHSYFLRKNLIYTAMTRAKKKLIIIGDKQTITVSAKKKDTNVRNSYLRERMFQNMKELYTA